MSIHDQCALEPVDMEKIKASIDDAIQKLLKERKWIIQEYADKLQKLQDDRAAALGQNEGHLKELGVKEADIPAPPPLNVNLGMIRKLDNSQIMSLLKDFMQPAVEYSSSVLLDYLGISYMDFKKFVHQNSGFINFKGKNKGRVYILQ